MMDLRSQIRRLSNMRGTDYTVHDTPAGRIITKSEVAVAAMTEEAREPRYDVVTIGGYTWLVAGAYESVNQFFDEKNHIFASGFTAAQVNAGSWTWGRGDAGTYFAIAAIPTGTRDRLPNWEGNWWNTMVPTNLLKARSIGHNMMGGPVTLTLTIGAILG